MRIVGRLRAVLAGLSPAENKEDQKVGKSQNESDVVVAEADCGANHTGVQDAGGSCGAVSARAGLENCPTAYEPDPGDDPLEDSGLPHRMLTEHLDGEENESAARHRNDRERAQAGAV